jgi:hypothetical protein
VKGTTFKHRIAQVRAHQHEAALQHRGR